MVICLKKNKILGTNFFSKVVLDFVWDSAAEQGPGKHHVYSQVFDVTGIHIPGLPSWPSMRHVVFNVKCFSNSIHLDHGEPSSKCEFRDRIE